MTQVFDDNGRRTCKRANVSGLTEIAELLESISITLGGSLGDVMSEKIDVPLV